MKEHQPTKPCRFLLKAMRDSQVHPALSIEIGFTKPILLAMSLSRLTIDLLLFSSEIYRVPCCDKGHGITNPLRCIFLHSHYKLCCVGRPGKPS